MPQPARRMQYADLTELKELLALSTLDFAWVMGFNLGSSWASTNPEKARRPINDPVLSALTRLLRTLAVDGDVRVLPRMPTPAQVYEQLRGPYERITGRELAWRRFGILCGVSAFSSYTWQKGRPVTARAQRLLLFLDFLIKHGGDSAFKRYLADMDLEAKARGFGGGLEDVFRAGTWGRRGAAMQTDPVPVRVPKARKPRTQRPKRAARSRPK